MTKVVLFHLFEVSRVARFIEMENRMVVAGEGDGEVVV